MLIKDNIVDGKWRQASIIRGLSEEYGISNVVFENLVYAGKRVLSAEDLNLDAGTHTENITFK